MRPSAVAGLAGLLAACSPSEPRRDVAYYRDHAADRSVELTGCATESESQAARANCAAALAADRTVVSKRFWTLPPTPPRVQGPGRL